MEILSTLTWLHLSDFHIGNPKFGDDASNKFERLINDLSRMHKENKLRPDLVFFTGDLVYGNVKNAIPLASQYEQFSTIIERIRNVYSPAIQKEFIFFVPGNHDVDRNKITVDQTAWLNACIEPNEISELVVGSDDHSRVQFRRYQERLDAFRAFVDSYSSYLPKAYPDRLFFTQHINVGDLIISVTGLDTAWSTSGDKDKGALWLGQSQLDAAINESRSADIKIILAHHPVSWLNESEENVSWRNIEHNFDFFLHGHVHEEYVTRINNCIKISCGCGYDSPRRESGYNIVRVVMNDCRADIFMRTYDHAGGDWIPRFIANKTSTLGVYAISNLPFAVKKSSITEPNNITASLDHPAMIANTSSRKIIDIFKYFTVAKAQDDEKFFIGRRKELKIGIGALMADGASIAIFGKAGVGKSSLALQLGYIAIGKHIGLVKENEIPSAGFSFPVVYYVCRKDIDLDIRHVFLSILINRSLPFTIANLISIDEIQSRIKLFENTFTHKQLLKIYNDGRTKETLDIAADVFINIASIISEVFEGKPLLLILDEYDVVSDKSGLASLIKSQVDCIKFIISGTAVDSRLLVQEHASIPRQLAEGQIELQPMTNEECKLILTKEAQKSGGLFSFTPNALDTLVKVACGMPFFIHFFGRFSLDAAVGRVGDNFQKPLQVTKKDVQDAIDRSIMKLSMHDATYYSLVINDWKKEVLLKLMAYNDDNIIDMSEIIPIAKSVGIVSQTCTKFTTSLARKDILIKNDKNLYEFADNRLKVFIMLRSETIFSKAKKILNHLARTK